MSQFHAHFLLVTIWLYDQIYPWVRYLPPTYLLKCSLGASSYIASIKLHRHEYISYYLVFMPHCLVCMNLYLVQI